MKHKPPPSLPGDGEKGKPAAQTQKSGPAPGSTTKASGSSKSSAKSGAGPQHHQHGRRRRHDASVGALHRWSGPSALPIRQRRDILLVLDEVARVDGFKVANYLSVAREARASAVVVYQGLEQLAEREGGKSGVKAVLGTVGTQIYLREAKTGTVEHLLEGTVFGTRRVDHWSETKAAGREPAYQRHTMEESGLSATALQALPAGPYAALVVGAGLPPACPVLVDLADSSVTKPPPARNAGGRSGRPRKPPG